MAKAIRLVTKKYYNHSSLSLDSSLDNFFSFGRRYPKYALPAGFVIEHRNKGFYALHPDIPIKVLEGEVTDEQFSLIVQRLTPFIAEPKKYKYGIDQALYMTVNREYENGNKYVCSVFVATMLKDIVSFDKELIFVQPEDFLKLGWKTVYEGEIKDYKYEEQQVSIKSTVASG